MLADQAAASGAKRGAHAHFALASGGADEQNVGDIEAGDQKHERSERGKRNRGARKRIFRVGFGTRKFFRKRPDRDAFIDGWEILRQALRDDVERSASLCHRDAGLQAGEKKRRRSSRCVYTSRTVLTGSSPSPNGALSG